MALAQEELAKAALRFLAGATEEALAIAPLHELENAAGTELAKRGDHAAAEAHYRRAIALDPAFFKPHNNLANLLRSRDPWAAVAHYREALRIEPSAQRAWANLGNVFVDLGLLIEAADSFRSALARKAGPDVEVRLGAALEALGDVTDAMAAYRRAAALGDAAGAARAEELTKAIERFGPFGRAIPKTPGDASPADAGEARRSVVEAKGEELDALLAPLPVATFVREFWAKKPLFMKGFANKYRGLFDGPAFVRAVSAPAAPNTLRANFDKRTPPARSLGGEPPAPLTSLLPITPEQAGTLFDAGATICVSEIETRAPALRPFVSAIRRQLGYAGKVAFNAYASAPGGGFNWHFDGRVATTLQIEGSKRWRFSRHPATTWPQGNGVRMTDGSAAYAEKDLVRAEWERLSPMDPNDIVTVILEPGDLLMLPAGVWHDAEAGAAGSIALNLAFLPLTHTRIVETILDWSLAGDPAWRATLPMTRPDGAAPGAVEAESLAALAAQLRRAADTLAAVAADSELLADVWGSYVLNGSAPNAARPSNPPIARGDRLRVHAGAEVYARDIEGGARLLLWCGAGRPLTLSGAAAAVARRVLAARGPAFLASEALAWTGGAPLGWAEGERLLAALLTRGVLERVNHGGDPPTPAQG